jgi:Transposase DDE domain
LRRRHARAVQDAYRPREQLPEPVFGQIKQARGFRQFLLRGFEKVRAEWATVCTVHNLLKLAQRRNLSETLPSRSSVARSLGLTYRHASMFRIPQLNLICRPLGIL